MSSIITTPTEAWLRDAISGCRYSFSASSPYVSSIFPEILGAVPNSVKKTFLTRTDIRDFAVGSSDLDALCRLAEANTTVLSAPRLHAKVYVVDASLALVTSANATRAGLNSNRECGLAIQDAETAQALSRLIHQGFGDPESVNKWTISELRALKRPTEAMKELLPPIPPSQIMVPMPTRVTVESPAEQRKILSSLGGWKELVLEQILLLDREEFTTEDAYAICLPVAAQKYPRNHHPADKIRQQLQNLRDMGLIEFVDRGYYRRLIGP